MISIATLVALTIMVVTSQRYLIEGQKQAVSSECFDLAANGADALLAEIGRKQFDANTTYSYYQPTTDFTGAGSLGPNAAELSPVTPWPDVFPFKSISAFNDVDDYNNYQRTLTPDLLGSNAPISLSVTVYYVSSTNDTSKVSYQTYLKRVVVTAQQSTYLSPVRFSMVIGY